VKYRLSTRERIARSPFPKNPSFSQTTGTFATLKIQTALQSLRTCEPVSVHGSNTARHRPKARTDRRILFLDRLEPQERSATVVCRSDCFFVSSDHMNRDWRATVDERPERLISSHGVLATVKLTKGRHLVSMSYVPSTLYEGIEISAASCALTILLCGIASFARRRTPDVR
jgi:hypothetical protein